MSKTTKRRAWNRTSASQHSAYQRCRRYWYFGWIERIKGPPTPAMQRGTDIHTEIEHYLKTGETRDSEYSEFKLNYRPYVESVVPHLPPPKHKELIIEHPITLECGPGLPTWVGFIDVGFSAVAPLKIRDVKTTSDFRYAKTEKELLENIQLISYGKWAYKVAGHEGEIDLGHIYVKTEKKIVRKKPMTKVVNVIVEQAHVEDVWEREMETVAEMVEAAKLESVHELPPTVTACSDYGGCPFREQCGLPEMSLRGLFNQSKNKGNEMANAFLEKLKKKNAAKGGGNGDGKGILPEDAPSRETSSEESDKIRAEAEAKKEKAELAAKKKAEKVEKAAAKKAAKNGKSNGAGFTLYIDCMPKKDVNSDVAPVLFEDWFSPIVEAMNKVVAEDGRKLANYLLLPYAEEKALVLSAVSESIANLPPAMIVNTRTLSANDALSALVPHATLVVTATR